MRGLDGDEDRHQVNCVVDHEDLPNTKRQLVGRHLLDPWDIVCDLPVQI